MADDDRTKGLRLAGVGLEFAAAVAGLTLLGAGIGVIGGTYPRIRQAIAKPEQGPAKGKRDARPPEDRGR